MTTRTVALLCLLLASVLGGPTGARAQGASAGIDGCSILASVVYTEVTVARLGHSSEPAGDPLFAGHDETSLCHPAAASVTRAFAAALRRSNLHVTWGFHTGYSGNYCLSHSLSRCYPSRDPAMPPFGQEDRSFVLRSWQAVQGAVSENHALYPGSDVARFNGSELGRSIRRSLYRGAIGRYRHLAAEED